VLALLFGRPTHRFFLREIVRAIGGGSGAVQRELAQLAGAGLIVRDREGRQVYFSANTSSPVFPELKGITEKTAGAADVLRAELAHLLEGDRIAAALIYGSTARAQQTPTSDVDLLIVGDVTLAELLPAIRAAEARLGREVNPAIFPVAEYRSGRRRDGTFLSRVVAGQKQFLKGDEHVLARLAR
jgi:predicted nucleotidyltransferase